MFCKNCGTKLADDAQFCESCGTAVTRQPGTVPVPTPAPEPAPVYAAAPAPEPVSAPEYAPEPAPGKKSFPKAAIAGIAVAIVAVAAGAFLFLGGSGKSSGSLNHELNFNNSGKFAYDDSRLYFISPYNSGDDETALYSTDYKGVNKKMLVQDDDITSMRIVDGKLYYRTSGDNTYTLSVMNTEGSDNRTILELDESFSDYDVRKGVVYYISDSVLHAYDMDKEEDQVLAEHASEFSIGSSLLFYFYEDVISSYRLKDGTVEELCTSSGVFDLAADGDTLYFGCDTGLSSISARDNWAVNKVISDSFLNGYTIYGDYIYYVHELSDDEVDALIAYLDTDSETTKLMYQIALIGTGSLYRAEKSGGAGEDADSETALLRDLYSYPQGMYFTATLLSDEVEPLEMPE